MSHRLFVSLSALLALSTVALSGEPAAVGAVQMASEAGGSGRELPCLPTAEDEHRNRCLEYYSGIDSCADAYDEHETFCFEANGPGGRKYEACMELTEHIHDSCVDACGALPAGC